MRSDNCRKFPKKFFCKPHSNLICNYRVYMTLKVLMEVPRQNGLAVFCAATPSFRFRFSVFFDKGIKRIYRVSSFAV